jgi:hypothetical protein
MPSNVESVLVSLGASIIVLAIGIWRQRKPTPVSVLLAFGCGIIAFVLWPRAVLVEVPDLTGQSRDEAELKLTSLKLVPEPRPQQAPNTPLEHVVPSSQEPLPGTKVRSNTVVRFSVSSPISIPRPSIVPNSGVVTIFTPKGGSEVTPKRGADNIFRFEVQGTIEAVDLTKSQVLLWLQPIEPPSDQPGWYLQRLPTEGIRSVSGNTWRGICRIGSEQYPPHDGDFVDVVATVVAGDEAQPLLARQGPVTTVVLPGSASKIMRLRVRLQ